MNSQTRTLVVIPAHNEMDSIEQVIREVRSANNGKDIIVVNDASTDETSELARSMGIRTADLPFRLGIGGAVQTGFRIAELLEYDVVVQVDADGQHDPSCIDDLIAPIITGEADISIGSRRLHNGNSKLSLIRSIGIRFFSWLTSKATSQRITDCSSGFRALNRRAFTLFADDYPVDFPDAEALISAHRAGLRIREVPARFRARNTGISSLRRWKMMYYPFKEVFSIAVMMTRHQRLAD